MAKSTNPSGMIIWVTTPGKEARRSEVPNENGGNTEWVAEEKKSRLKTQKYFFPKYIKENCLNQRNDNSIKIAKRCVNIQTVIKN